MMRWRIVCAICKKRCRTWSGLAAHVVVQHQPPATSRLVCPVCGRLGRSGTGIAAHVRLAHGVPSRREAKP